MKHIKTFAALNESLQDSSEILDFIKNSPEGNDLFKVSSYPTFEENFDARRSGRVHCNGIGAKTYVEKTPRGYCFQSLSNGKIFGQECYPTIEECIRQLWSNVVSKYVTNNYGVKKQEIRDWVLVNIPIGSGLGNKEILDLFSAASKKEAPDFEEIIKKSKSIRILEDVFGARFTRAERTLNPNDVIYKSGSIDLFRPFGLDICDNEENPYTFSVNVKVNLSGKNKSTTDYNNNNNIILGDPSTALRYLDKAIPTWALKIVENPGKFIIFKTPKTSPALIELVRGIFINSAPGSTAYDALDNLLSNLKSSDPLAFESIVKKLELAGAFPELTSKYRESESGTLKGASILNRFGV
jgi:hypothetical protein